MCCNVTPLRSMFPGAHQQAQKVLESPLGAQQGIVLRCFRKQLCLQGRGVGAASGVDGQAPGHGRQTLPPRPAPSDGTEPESPTHPDPTGSDGWQRGPHMPPGPLRTRLWPAGSGVLGPGPGQRPSPARPDPSALLPPRPPAGPGLEHKVTHRSCLAGTFRARPAGREEAEKRGVTGGQRPPSLPWNRLLGVKAARDKPVDGRAAAAVGPRGLVSAGLHPTSQRPHSPAARPQGSSGRLPAPATRQPQEGLAPAGVLEASDGGQVQRLWGWGGRHLPHNHTDAGAQPSQASTGAENKEKPVRGGARPGVT